MLTSEVKPEVKYPFLRKRSEHVAKIALNVDKFPKFEAFNEKSWAPRTMVVKYLRNRARLTRYCVCAESYVVFGRPFAIRQLSVCMSVSRLCPVCLTVCPVCDVGVLWPNGWMDQDDLARK